MDTKCLISGVFLAFMALLISGCDRQPTVESLHSEIAEVLDHEFRQDLFELVSVRRLGSAPYRDADTGDQRLTVYFNVQIRFREAFDLTTWDGLNGASIAFLLGATEKGVHGIRQGGNNVDDILRVHGSRVYALRQGKWRALPTAHRKSPATEKAAEAQRLISRISELAERSAKRLGGAEQAIIDKELTQSVKRIERALDQQAMIFSVASGPSHGAYYRYVKALEQNTRSLGFRVRNYPTQGSVENCQLVQSGSVDIAIAQSNITALAVDGEGLFKPQGRLSDIRAVSALFPEYLQIVVASKAGIENLEALKGKRIDLGLPESGTRVDALRLLDAAGLSLPDFAEIHESGLDTAAGEMRAGELDAFFTTLQAPAHALQRLLAHGEARLLSLPAKIQKRMREQHGVYRPAILPAHTYPSQRDPVSTLGVTATLIVRSDLSDARVEQLLDGLFRSVTAIAEDNLRVALLSARTAREGITVKLHPGADRYFTKLDEAKRK
jgi:TRAP transporter TAXI family solute receptor